MNRRFAPVVAGLLGVPLLFSVAPRAAADPVIAARKGKVYHTHVRQCASARRIRPENRVRFDSPREAERAGRRLCRRCAALAAKAKAAGEKGDADPPGRQPRRTGGEKGTQSREKPRPGEDAGHPRGDRPGAGRGSPAMPEVLAVAEVLAGGTLVLDNGEKAVLLGVVCPDRGQPNWRDAVRFLEEQTRGRRLRLSADEAAWDRPRRDALGRLVLYAMPEPDGRDLGGELLFQGYAWLDRGAAFTRRAAYLRHEEAAWRAGRGIWKQAPGDARDVVTGRHAWAFHPPGCRHARYMCGLRTLSLNEARSRRLVPCSEFHEKAKKQAQSKTDRRASLEGAGG